MKRVSICLIGILTIFNLVIAKSNQDEIKVTVEERQIKDLSPSGLSLVFYVNLSNSSKKTYFLSSYNYRFVVNQVEYLRLQTDLDNSVGIDANGTTMIAVPIKITYDLLFKAVPGLENKDNIQCYLMGELAFSEGRKVKRRVPVAFNGEFPIFKGPEIEPIAINAKTLTIGGADITFDLNIKNRNGFELLVDRISYKLAFGGHPVGEGIIRGNGGITGRGDRTYSIPLLLNFFEVGKDVHGILQGDSAPCQFSGELEIETAWGMISIPFNRSRDVAIKKNP